MIWRGLFSAATVGITLMTTTPTVAQACEFHAEVSRMLASERSIDAQGHRLRACLRAAPSDALNAHDENGDTVLILAARALNPDMIAHLLALGADPNIADTGWRNWTPLIAAMNSFFGADPTQVLPLFDMLIAGGADVNYASDLGETAIQVAAGILDDNWRVDYLLNAGADPLAVDSAGNPALFWTVAFQCNMAGARRLIAAHGDAWRVDDDVVARLRGLAESQCATLPGGQEFIAEVFH